MHKTLLATVPKRRGTIKFLQYIISKLLYYITVYSLVYHGKLVIKEFPQVYLRFLKTATVNKMKRVVLKCRETRERERDAFFDVHINSLTEH